MDKKTQPAAAKDEAREPGKDAPKSGKLPYSPPRLARYGKLKTLTSGGTGVMVESGSNKQENKRP